MLSDSPDTQPNDSSLSPDSHESRKRARENVNKPRKRMTKMRKVRPAIESQEERDAKAKLDEVDRRTRWMVLKDFRKDEWEQVIKRVYGSDINPDSATYKVARELIMDHCRTYKSRSLKLFITHVESLIEIDADVDGYMHSESSPRALGKWFVKAFNKENFLYIFYFLVGYLDVEASSPLGRYYMQHIYANLATKVKLHIDLVKRGDIGQQDSWDKIRDFYDTMSTKAEFDQLSLREFKELTSAGARFRNGKRRRPKDLPDNDPDFTISGPPPAPTVPTHANI